MNEERAMSPKIKPPTGKEEIMKTTVIETIVMSNNHLADIEKTIQNASLWHFLGWEKLV